MKPIGFLGWVIIVVAGVAMAHAVWKPTQNVQPSTLDLVHHLDRDGDGEISQKEYDRVSDGELPFATVDLNEDGVLQAHEIEVLVVHISPLADLGNRLRRVR